MNPLRPVALAVLLAGTLALTRAALLVFPFQSVHGWVRAWCVALAACAGRGTGLAETTAAVSRVNRLLFGPDACLTESLVSEALLVALGIDATLRIGVARKPGGGIDAHAWVASGGDVVACGREDLERYVPLENGALQRGLATWMARPGRPFHVRKLS